ncbi:MAG TPA: SH3 domain-containing protein [Bdellovibrionota bacterium]|jgi:hypothetical protein|nr:SH3 domain-containing protein [Bdellovibrionota bacterium]
MQLARSSFGFRPHLLAIALACTNAALAVAQSSASKVLPVDYELRGKGILLQVSEVVPVFARPDPKSAKLAEADVGTVLLAVDLSPKRTWVRVEDDEGTQGWVPVDRTDLGELLEAQIKIREAEIESTRETLAAAKEAAQENAEASVQSFQSGSEIVHVLGPLYQFANPGGGGFLYSLLFQFFVPERGILRQRAFGPEFAWTRKDDRHQYEFRLRYTSKFSRWGRLSYGPDVAYHFSNAAVGARFALGYRIGYDVTPWLPLEIRGAVTTRSTDRWLGEISWRVRF